MFSRSQFNKEYILIDQKSLKKTMIFNFVNKDNVSNFHLIFILPAISKILERIMYNRVYNDLDSTGFFVENNLVFKEIIQLNVSCSNLHKIVQALLKKENFTRSFYRSF